MMNQKQTQELLNELKAHKKIRIAVTDIDGILRGKYMHVDKFISSLEKGFGFCNVVFGWDSQDNCYNNNDFSGWHNGYQDILAKPDPSTFRKIPWDQGTPLVLGDFWQTQDQPLSLCPRQLLAKVEKKAKSMGFQTKVGIEFEWFNFRETPESLATKKFQNPTPISPGMFGYSLLRSSLNQDYFHDMINLFEEVEVPLEGLHTETGPGVYEAALKSTSALEAADRAILFKSGVKELALKHGIIASFMARWNGKLPGCSGHIHQSLIDLETNEPLFYSDQNPRGMSPLFESYLAGQLECLPKLLPMLAPTVNSYKRLVEGYWAPTRMSWGTDNRTCALRVISESRKASRVEVRVGGADINPYLAVAASIAAGLYGIENQLSLKQTPAQGNAYKNTDCEKLSPNLESSTKLFKESGYARRFFGDEFATHFSQTREWEWQQYQNAVTNWELERYFEII